MIHILPAPTTTSSAPARAARLHPLAFLHAVSMAAPNKTIKSAPTIDLATIPRLTEPEARLELMRPLTTPFVAGEAELLSVMCRYLLDTGAEIALVQQPELVHYTSRPHLAAGWPVSIWRTGISSSLAERTRAAYIRDRGAANSSHNNRHQRN